MNLVHVATTLLHSLFAATLLFIFLTLKSLNAVEEKQKQKLASTQNVLKLFSSSLY